MHASANKMRNILVLHFAAIMAILSSPAPAIAGEGFSFDNGWKISPKASISEQYNDNIYKIENNKTGDFITTLKLGTDASQKTDTHTIKAYGEVESKIFADHSDDNATNVKLGLRGDRKITDNTKIFAHGRYRLSNEERGDDISNPLKNNDSPVRADEFFGSIGADHKFRSLGFKYSANATRLDYDDVSTLAGLPRDQDFRDRTEYRYEGTLRYSLMKSFEALATGRIHDKKYDNSAATDRSSLGYQALIGGKYAPSKKFVITALIGRFTQNFKQSGYKDFDGLDVDINAQIKPTENWSNTFRALHSARDATTLGIGGMTLRDYRYTTDYKLPENLTLRGMIRYTDSEYMEGLGSASGTENRQDGTCTLRAGLAYSLAENTEAELAYQYSERDSNALNADFEQSAVMLTLKSEF